MKAIKINAPKDISFFEIAKPERKSGEALLKLLYGGLCGSDLGSFRGTFSYFSYPKIPGHEFSAEIVEIDDNEQGLKPGMVVTCNPYFNCGHCYSCKRGVVNACMDNKTMGVQREGAFAEYITMPIERIYDGKGIPPMTLALIEPFCIAYHGIKRAKVSKDDTMLIVGAGTIGILAAMSAKLFGAQVWISDISPKKLEMAKSFGVDGVILNDNPEHFNEQVSKITNNNGFTVTVEAVGLPSTFLQCIDATCFGGSFIQVGVGKNNADFNFTLLQKKELNVYGSRNALKEDFIELIDLVKENNLLLEHVITNVYSFNDADKAFEDFDKNSASMLKVILDFTK